MASVRMTIGGHLNAGSGINRTRKSKKTYMQSKREEKEELCAILLSACIAPYRAIYLRLMLRTLNRTKAAKIRSHHIRDV
ncbi:hypothetical protein N7465_001828 [Penicillium sp. CMV-2018d]|nr:hypothetical protein N7465_001828 [Penicillium sp. CMV-2018d]